jgi:pimeloyl-ACP methyl ester carboxylesterase
MTAERRVWLTKEGIGMRGARTVDEAIGRTVGDDLRRRLLAGAPVAERRLDLAGVSTAVLEGGEGPPVVLLHGQGGWAGVWLPVMTGLARDHRVVAPDLPGLGASRVQGAPPDADRVLAWLGELLDRTCPVPPVLVGVSLGGSIAARFAAAHGDRLAGLVLVSMGGLVDKVRIPPPMLLALVRHSLRPTERTVWGRPDRVMPLATARQASVRYGWPLDVIDDAGHFRGVDQPEAFLQALRRALDQG